MGDFGGGAYGVTPAAEGSYSAAEQVASARMGSRVQSASSLSAPVSVSYRAGSYTTLCAYTAAAFSDSGVMGTAVPGVGYSSGGDLAWSTAEGTFVVDAGRRSAVVVSGPRRGNAIFRDGYSSGGFASSAAEGTFVVDAGRLAEAVSAGERNGNAKLGSARISRSWAASIGERLRVRQGVHRGGAVSRGAYHANFGTAAARTGSAVTAAAYGGDFLWERPVSPDGAWGAQPDAAGIWTPGPDTPVRAWAQAPEGAGRWTVIPGVSGTWQAVQVLGLKSDG